MNTVTNVVGRFCRVGVALSLLAPLFVSAPASAQVACGDTTCGKGFVCETQPVACPAIACAEGQECPPCEGTVQVCAPAPCTSQDDCGAHMVCAAHEVVNCGAAGVPEPTCERGAECPAPEKAPECTTSTQYQCTPRWLLPCEVDADCGGGFQCVELESCGCAAGPAAPTPPEGSRATPTPAERAPAADPSCGCEPSGVKACEVLIEACSVDADCEAGWTCDENPQGVCSSDANGQTRCTPAEPPRVCTPPYAHIGVDVGTVEGRPVSTLGPGSGAPNSERDGAGSSASGGGCSVSAVPVKDGALLAWLALGLGAAVGLRRRTRG